MPWTETQPTALAVNLAELKSHLRLDSADEDGLLESYAKAAAQFFEINTRRRLISRSCRLDLEDFPAGGCGIELPFAPVSAVTSVQYYDTAGTLTTWASSNYLVDTTSLLPRVLLAPTLSYPPVQSGRHNAVQVNFTAGYGGTYASVPEGVRFAVGMLAAHFFRHRTPVANGSVAELPYTLRYAIDAYKIWERVMEDPGQKTKRIDLKQKTVTNTLGSLSETLATFARPWASFRPLRMDERFQSAGRHSVRAGNFRLYWRDDVTPDTVIGYDGLDWRVLGISPVGENEELDLTAEAVS